MKCHKTLYIYKCIACRYEGQLFLTGDDHEGEETKCAKCLMPVLLNWDDGVTFYI